jgi:hypothetical protein
VNDDDAGGEPEQPPADVGEGRWHLGLVTRVYYGSETGTLRSESTGREYRFRWPFVEIRGPIPRIDGLREGMRVGFDLAHTQRGVRVTVIRVFE